MLKSCHKPPVLCFGKTKNGSPKHPLMLPYATELENYLDEVWL